MKKRKVSEYIILGASILVLLLVAFNGIGKTNWEEKIADATRQESLWQKFEGFINSKFDKWQNIEYKRENNWNQRSMMEQFALIYVPCTEEEQKDGHLTKIATTGETQRKIDAFNEYMLNGSGKQYAESIGYMELPEGKLTIEYMMENQEEIVDMIAWWHQENDYSRDAQYEIDQIYDDLCENDT
ncbi:hypothetical protein [Roseburia sp. 499]|uniref:hypothetical protein n=1 Tax=Roseburia sp. 499 TaxID=1261634 RepID=UPI0009526EDB|nr:hypothetical protein [Roseburia sp. 499]WVK70925.1 hypothetical protein BIV20_05165 [Roseburia sp. 499]